MLTLGAARSILLPLSGPAVAQLPTPSQTTRLAVAALEVATPSATLVLSVKLASALVAKPDPPSLVEQFSATLAACQTLSAGAHVTTGALLSICNPLSCAVLQLPATSQITAALVWALSLSWSAPTFVVSVTAAGVPGASPETASLGVQLNVWSPRCQSLGGVGQPVSGAVLS